MFRFGLVAFLTMTSIAQAAHAAVFGKDDREYVVTTPGSPYSPVGLVRVGLNRATGTLISRCDVLTVQHVYGLSKPIVRDPRGERAKFSGSVGSERPISSKGTIIAAGGWKHLKPSDQRYYDDIGSDWMIIRLDKCLGEKLGWARLGTSANGSGATDPKDLLDAGFPADRDSELGLSVDPACAIRGVASRVLFHDCATMRGNSGGPIFRLISTDGVQRMEIVGIVSAVWSYSYAATEVRGQENVAAAAWNVTYDPAHPTADCAPASAECTLATARSPSGPRAPLSEHRSRMDR